MSGFKGTFPLVVAFFISICSYAQTYKIDVHIDGIKDTSLLLGYHFGEKKYVQDTAIVDSKGNAVFEGDTLLKGGIYLVILPSKTYFEILVSENQRFGVKTSASDLVNKIEFTNSPENSAFADYQRFMIEQQMKNKDITEKLKKLDEKSDSVKIYQKQLAAVNADVENYWNKLIEKNKGTFLATIIKSMKNVEMPEIVVPEGTKNADSLKWMRSYQFNKEHFFDNIPFSDPKMLRTPILENRINTYFDRVIIPQPDSIIPEAIKVVELAKQNKEVYQFVLQHLVNKFQTSNMMGMDGVFVALAEKYYLGGQVWWADKTLLDKINERVTLLKPNLIGNICPDLNLPNQTGQPVRISSIKKKITVVYFWDPDCSHCKKTTPELKKTYDKYKAKGLEVYAVYTQGDQPKLVDYINKNQLNWINVWDPQQNSNFRNLFDIYSTPVIYVLNENKKIIAKRISVESLNSMLEQLLVEPKK